MMRQTIVIRDSTGTACRYPNDELAHPAVDEECLHRMYATDETKLMVCSTVVAMFASGVGSESSPSTSSTSRTVSVRGRRRLPQ